MKHGRGLSRAEEGPCGGGQQSLQSGRVQRHGTRDHRRDERRGCPCDPADDATTAGTRMIGIGIGIIAARQLGNFPIGRAIDRLRLSLAGLPDETVKFRDAADFLGRLQPFVAFRHVDADAAAVRIVVGAQADDAMRSGGVREKFCRLVIAGGGREGQTGSRCCRSPLLHCAFHRPQ